MLSRADQTENQHGVPVRGTGMAMPGQGKITAGEALFRVFGDGPHTYTHVTGTQHPVSRNRKRLPSNMPSMQCCMMFSRVTVHDPRPIAGEILSTARTASVVAASRRDRLEIRIQRPRTPHDVLGAPSS